MKIQQQGFTEIQIITTKLWNLDKSLQLVEGECIIKVTWLLS